MVLNNVKLSLKQNYKQIMKVLLLKHISLLKYDTEEKQVKKCIIKYVKNFGCNIQMDQWD